MSKQSVKGGVWYISGRKKRQQRGDAFPFPALAAPILGKLAVPIFKKLIGEDRKYRRPPYGLRQN